jgi:cell pole-organizing protein PopZ
MPSAATPLAPKVPDPTVKSAAAESVAVAASATTETGKDAPKAKGERALEDMLAEIMRPMVRQWLDDNMKQALEKAVRAEVADSVRDMVAKTAAEKKS